MFHVQRARRPVGSGCACWPPTAVLFDWWMCVSGFVAAPSLLVSFWLCCCCVAVKLLPPLVQRACLPCPPLLPDPLAGGYQQLLAWPSFRVDLPNTPQQVGPWAVCVVLMYVCVVQLYDSVHTRTPVCPPSAEAAQRVLSGLHGSRHALLGGTALGASGRSNNGLKLDVKTGKLSLWRLFPTFTFTFIFLLPFKPDGGSRPGCGAHPLPHVHITTST